MAGQKWCGPCRRQALKPFLPRPRFPTPESALAPSGTDEAMLNHARTFMLLAAMTALFLGIGYLIGGSGGMVIAFVIAAGMNVFAYWNSDKVVLRMYGAREVRSEEHTSELQSLIRI